MEELIIAMSAHAALEYFKKIEQENNVKALDFGSFKDEKEENPILSIEGGDTATIKIVGILGSRPQSFCDRFFRIQRTSYNDIVSATEEIKTNSEIKNVKLLFDTPGGMVKGLDEAYQALFSLRDGRRVTSISQGDILSAGYWLASAANEIIASSPSDMIGSVGLVVIGFDDSKMMKEIGIRGITIRSKNAENKSPEIGTKKGEKIIQDEVDAVERIFHQRIAEGRGISTDVILKNFGQGSIFVAKDPDPDKRGALSRGMIDNVTSRIESNNPKNDNFPIDNNIRGENMTYEELVAATSPDQTLKAEVLAKAEERFQAGKNESSALIKKVGPYLSTESKYPAAVGALALKVLSGESKFEALETVVTVLDSQAEEKKSAQAKKETDDAGETIPVQTGQNQDGIISSDAEAKKTVERLRTIN